ncbi:MAG: glycoside hydrolase family 28 protein [Salinibacter sp.]
MSDQSSRRRFLKNATLASGGGLGASMVGGRSAAEETGRTIYNIVDFGAEGDGQTNDAGAIQTAIDRCTEAGGGTVLVPAGSTFLTGSFKLKSNVNLHLETGATLLASPNPDDYEEKTLIKALDAERISLTGRGTIDGQGRKFMAELDEDHHQPKDWRPRMMILEHCRNVRLQDLTLRRSAFWTVHLAGCTDVAVEQLSILNDRRLPNCDGIAVDCSTNVRISDCHIEAGDDCIVLKTLERYAEYGNCENVTVTNCTLASTSAALKIGTETINDIRNVTYTNCVARSSSRGLGIMLRDGGTVENILYANITVETRYYEGNWWGAAEPIYITALPRDADHELGIVRNIRFSNIVCRGENGVFIRGSKERAVEDVLLQNVKVQVEKWAEDGGGTHDIRPAAEYEGIHKHPTAGIYGEKARGLTLDNCTVEWAEDPPSYFRHALELHDVSDFDTRHFTGASAHPGRYRAQLIG